MDEWATQFQAGIDDYWRGYIPDDWEDESHRKRCFYHMGWFMASEADNGMHEDERCPEDA